MLGPLSPQDWHNIYSAVFYHSKQSKGQLRFQDYRVRLFSFCGGVTKPHWRRELEQAIWHLQKTKYVPFPVSWMEGTFLLSIYFPGCIFKSSKSSGIVFLLCFCHSPSLFLFHQNWLSSCKWVASLLQSHPWIQIMGSVTPCCTKMLSFNGYSFFRRRKIIVVNME